MADEIKQLDLHPDELSLRELRNNNNANYSKVNENFNALKDLPIRADEALTKATAAESNAIEAKEKADDTQTQLNNIIIASGTSDAEVIQARGNRPVLNERLNDMDVKMDFFVSINEYDHLKVAIAQGYDWAPALAQAIDDIPDNGVVIFPPEDFYISSVSSSGKGFSLIGYGAKIIQATNSTSLYLVGGWDGAANVSSIATAAYDFSGEGALNVPKVSLATPMSLTKGDIVKIFSDDQIDGAKTGTLTSKRRKGEYAIVGDVVGNDVYLTGPLRETYVTNIRLAKLKDISFNIEGFTFDTLDQGDAAGWNASMVTIRAARDVTIPNCKALRGYSSFLTLVGLYGYSITNLQVKNLKNNPGTGNYGYGINDISCEYGNVYSSLFLNVRHGYTTNTNSIVEGSTDYESYGRSANTNVTGFAHGCSNTGFDTHDEAYNVRFNSCTSVGNYRGKDSSGSGFSARGRKISFINCVALNCRYGFNIFEQYANSTREISLINCEVIGSSDYSVYVNITGTGEGVKGFKIIGGKFEASGGSRVFSFIKAEVEIEGAKIISKQGNSYVRFIHMDASIVKIKNVDIDISGYTSSNGRIFSMYNNSNLTVEDVRAVFGATASNFILEGDGTANIARITKFGADKSVSIATGITDYFFGSRDEKIPNMTVYQDVTANDQIPNIANNANDVIYLRLRSTTGSFAMGAIPDGYKRGQLLIIRNSGSSSNTITIRTGSAYNAILYGAVSRVLSNEQAITLIWDGTDWMAAGQ
ncbi:hypothetical protein [Metabacillus idriensis]|uniref:hypothetical protein n=1 Tax=Metabacillus idriensis TaxID=324768 RepID=UPI00174A2CFB|nr:hypothetical protein [Metabacillus idriensis]